MKLKFHARNALVTAGLLLASLSAGAFNLTVARTDVTCYGANNGTATANTTGINVPALATYQWSNGATTKTISNLAPGSYTVTVTYNGSSKTGSATVVQPSLLTANVTTTKTCVGSCSGSAFAAISGGTSPYNRHWSNGGVANNMNGLCAGTYSLTVTDANGCSAVGAGNVVASAFTLATTSTQVGCTTLGSATLSVVNDTPPFTYHWSNGATTATVNNLNTGTYTVTVTNAMGCTAATSVAVTHALPLTIATTGSSICSGTCNGNVSVITSGGISPIAYAWSNGPTGASQSSLCAGAYAVTVHDASGCVVTGTANVTEFPSPAVAVTHTNIACYGNCTGIATSSVTGGTTPYTRTWSNGATNNFIGGLCAGTHSITVTDANGCSAADFFSVTQPAAPLNVNLFAISPAGDICDGFIQAGVSGGTTPYAYHWSYNNASSSSINGLCNGNYSVTITDANGCTTTASTQLGYTPLSLVTSGTVITCFGACNGSAQVSATGGAGGYSYLWSNGSSSALITGLCPGLYTVTATDGAGQTATGSVALTQPTAMSVTVSKSNHGGCVDSAIVQVSGGTAPYAFQWSDGVTTALRGGLCPGTYAVTVTDANGCSQSTVITIGGSPLFVDVTNATTCIGACDGSSTASVSGGTAPYTFQWSDGATTATVSGLCAGIYGLVVYDAAGAFATDTAVITQAVPPACSISGAAPLCGSGASVTMCASTTGTNFLWNNGATTACIIVSTSGTYGVTVTNVNGCTSYCSVVISSCRMDESGATNNMALYPNPTTGNTMLEVNAASNGTAVLRLIDVTGKLFNTKTVTLTKGLNAVDLNVSDYADGIYLLQIVSDDNVQTLRLIKQ